MKGSSFNLFEANIDCIERLTCILSLVLDLYEQLMKLPISVEERVWITHAAFVMILNNPQAQSRFSYAYQNGLKKELQKISNYGYWKNWAQNDAKNLERMQAK